MEAKQQKIIEAWAAKENLELAHKEYYPNHDAGIEYYEFYDDSEDGYFRIEEEYNRRFIFKYYFLDDTKHTIEVSENSFRNIYAFMQAESDILKEDLSEEALSIIYDKLQRMALRIKRGDGYYN